MNQNKIYTGISSEYVQHWGFWEGARELIQNAGDQDSHDIFLQVNLDTRVTDTLVIKSFGAEIPKEMLLMGKSGKRDDDTKVGCYGEGFLLALLVLLRSGKELVIYNGTTRIIPTIEDHPQLGELCLVVEMVEDDFNGNPDEVFIKVSGLTAIDVESLEEKYLPFHMEKLNPCYWEQNMVVEHEGCQIFRYDTDKWQASDREGLCDKGYPKKVFVKGLYVCDLPDTYAFSYNLTPDLIPLDRDRKSVDTWDLQRSVAELLTDANAFELMVQMSEEKVPDLFEYYTPCSWQQVTHSYRGEAREETVSEALQRVSGTKFVEKYGEDCIAVREDASFDKKKILFKRIQMDGKIPVEVPARLHKLLPKKFTEVANTAPVRTVSPLKAVTQYYEANKKHMRSKARKELVALIEDLTLNS